MTLKKWLGEMAKKSAKVKQVSDELAVAYWIERIEGTKPHHGIFFSPEYVCFNVYYKGEERTEELHWRTHCRIGTGFLSDCGYNKGSNGNVFPREIGKVETLVEYGVFLDGRGRKTKSTKVKVEVLTYGGQYTFFHYFTGK